MSTNISTLRTGARRAAIERAEKEYKLQCDVFDTADRKAQATTTIAGALLAADLGFVSKLAETPSAVAQVILVIITAALGSSVLMALCAMFARDSELPASMAETEVKYGELLEVDTCEAFGSAEDSLLDQLLEALRKANVSVSTVSADKARWVHRAQISLIVAAGATIALTVALVFNPGLLSLKATETTSVEQALTTTSTKSKAPVK
jgi:hypothetical protein